MWEGAKKGRGESKDRKVGRGAEKERWDGAERKMWVGTMSHIL